MGDNFNESLWGMESAKKDGIQALSPKEFVFRYLKYLPWVLVCVAIAGAVAYFKIRYSVPLYHVQASMLIQEDEYSGASSKDPKFQELVLGQEPSNLGNEIQILKSSPVIDRVVRALHLETGCYNMGTIIKSRLIYPDAPFKIEIQHLADSNTGISLFVNVLNEQQFTLAKDGPKYFFGQPLEIGGNRISIVRTGDLNLRQYSTPQFRVTWTPSRQVAGGLMGGLQIALLNDGTTILSLTFTGDNPRLGVDVLNCLMRVYDSLKIEDKNRISTNTLQFIDAQLGSLQTQLSGVEGKSKGFMVENNAYDVTGQTSVYMNNIQELSKREAEQQVKLAVLDMLIGYVADPKNEGKLVPTSLGVEEPALLQFVTQYNQLELSKEANLRTTKPDNQIIKDMNTALAKIHSDMLQALRNVRQSYVIAINSLQKQQGANQAQLKGVPGKSMELLNIQRQQKILEDLYSFLLMKKLETSISSAATVSNSKVVEPAAASYDPISPNKKSIYTLYLIIGLLIPVGIIALLELLRDKVS